MKRKLFAVILALVAVATLTIGLFSVTAADDGGDKFEVTVTNLTRGQLMSPAVVATHKSKLSPLFTLGSPASPELAFVAEDAVNGPLVAALMADPNVRDVETIFGALIPPIMPGESASVEVDTGGKFRNVTVVGMLIHSNDGFYALNGVAGPKDDEWAIYLSPGYDAGSEANTENCDHIPGPFCGNPGVSGGAGEGYVHIHAGVHGIGTGATNLVPATHDWRNPVAKITIRRLGGDDDD